MKHCQQRNESGVIAGVFDAMLIIVLTCGLVLLIVNTSIVVHCKLKLRGVNAFALDLARDYALRSTDFSNNQGIANNISTLTQILYGDLPNLNIVVKTNQTFNGFPAVTVTTTMKSVPLIGPFGPVDVSDTSLSIYKKTVGYMGFQCAHFLAEVGGHQNNAPIAWVPIVDPPAAGGNLPPYTYVLQSPRISHLEHPNGVPDALHHHPPCRTETFRLPRGGWIQIHTPGFDQMTQWGVAAPTNEPFDFFRYYDSSRSGNFN